MTVSRDVTDLGATMGLKLVNIKFKDKETEKVTYGTCPAGALNHWKKRGYEEATDDEVAALRQGALDARVGSDEPASGPTQVDLDNGLVLDAPSGTVAIDPAAALPETVKDPDSDADTAAAGKGAYDGHTETFGDAAKPVVADPTAGDDAESATGKSARGGRRSS